MVEPAPRPTIGEALRAATACLARAGVTSARQDASALLAEVRGCDRLALLRQDREPFDPAGERDYKALLQRRLRGEPVSRIRRRREFWSLDLAIGPAVLDPRPDSETVVAAVLDHVGPRDRALRLLDLGTGSGCLLLALLSSLPNAWGLALDKSAAAAAVARANAGRLGLGQRTAVLVGDWLTALDGTVDVVVANPPYIRTDAIAALSRDVRAYDPVAALDGGADGLDAYRAIVPDLRRVLAPGGLAALEVGSGQASAVALQFVRAGFRVIETRTDLAGMPRCVVARSEAP